MYSFVYSSDFSTMFSGTYDGRKMQSAAATFDLPPNLGQVRSGQVHQTTRQAAHLAFASSL